MLYTDAKNVQILIKMMKEYNIKHIVISPGTRNFPFVHSVEKDPFFECYSIVDERSGAYFAMGLILETGEPVAVSCTSGTAAANYHSAVCESYYQNIPLVLLTADRNDYYYDHREPQKIAQDNLYGKMCPMAINVPSVTNENDEWYCYRIINEAFLELNHHGTRPIQINYAIEDYQLDQFHTMELPDMKKIKRVMVEDDRVWKEYALKIKSTNRIMIIYGQSRVAEEELQKEIEEFYNKTNSVISCDYTSNLHVKGTLQMSLLMDSMQGELFDDIVPDIVISMNGNYLSGIKWALKGTPYIFENWDINEEGKIVDEFRQLNTVFECTPKVFFQRINRYLNADINNHEYYDAICEKMNLISVEDIPYSNAYVIRETINKIPPCSNLHLGNIKSAYLAQMFPMNKDVMVYAHNGTTTIDGSLSSYIGQTFFTKKKSFCIMGDLSFFYDMNAIWNRYINKEVKILMINNGGGGEFHTNVCRISDSVDDFTAAKHTQSAEAWAKACGFEYLSARNIDDFQRNLDAYFNYNEKPVFFEVFTDIEKDSEACFLLRNRNSEILKNNKGNKIERFRKKASDHQKLQANFEICLNLLEIICQGEKLQNYFMKNNIKKIALYGFGKIGKVLYKIIEQCGVEIIYCIDKNCQYNYDGIKVVSMNDVLEKVDVVVITVPFDIENIKLSLASKVNAPLVSIIDIMKELSTN